MTFLMNNFLNVTGSVLVGSCLVTTAFPQTPLATHGHTRKLTIVPSIRSKNSLDLVSTANSTISRSTSTEFLENPPCVTI